MHKSTGRWEENVTFGERFRDERVRLDLTQDALGSFLETSRRTVAKWEANETYPDAKQLGLFAEKGADVLFIVTGVKAILGDAQGRAPHSPAERAAAVIQNLKLTEEDADLLTTVARRLAGVKE